MFTIITRVVEALAALNVLFIWAFSEYLERNRPSHPVGKFTLEVQNHGTSFFISQQENLVRIFSWPTLFILMVIVLGMEAASRSEK
jgi:hypothetical protein